MIFVLNAPLLTSYGDWSFRGPIDPAEARSRLAEGFVSAVGHAAAAELLTQILQLEIPVRRVSVHLNPGDCALVLRLQQRIPEGAILSMQELEKTGYELGWLQREL